ncbi:hypothetical protein BD779DRAFT_1678200 [Infundibulicybe gibba]|nr:hypothetical protein BD779DRAFT_1678200 [Infundibulicybe gibba]
MVLKLHGVTTQGSPSGLVATVLNEKQVPFEFIPVNTGCGEHKTAEYRACNPFCQAPYIDDDGFILYESRAICRYISMKILTKDRLRGLTPDMAKYDEYIATLSAKLDVYDESLEAEEISLVDLLHLSGGAALGLIGSDIMGQKPNVARWFNDLSSRESWRVLKDGIKGPHEQRQ